MRPRVRAVLAWLFNSCALSTAKRQKHGHCIRTWLVSESRSLECWRPPDTRIHRVARKQSRPVAWSWPNSQSVWQFRARDGIAHPPTPSLKTNDSKSVSNLAPRIAALTLAAVRSYRSAICRGARAAAARRFCYRSTGQTDGRIDGRTTDRCIDTAYYAASINNAP